jgi:MFS family permease
MFVGLASYAGEKDVGLWLATMALTAAATANGAARLAVGAAFDCWGVGRVLLLIVAADLLAAAILWAAPGVGGLLFLAAVSAGLALGGAAGVVSRLAADAAPDAPNSAFGLLFAAFAVGVSIGPLLGSAAGPAQTAWLVVGGLALPGLVLLSLRSRLHRSQAVGR